MVSTDLSSSTTFRAFFPMRPEGVARLPRVEAMPPVRAECSQHALLEDRLRPV